MNTSVLKAIKKLYKELGISSPDVLADIERDALTENTCRNGRDVVWYLDNENDVAVYIDTLEILSDEEITKELSDEMILYYVAIDSSYDKMYFDTFEELKNYFHCPDAVDIDDVDDFVNCDGMHYYTFRKYKSRL